MREFLITMAVVIAFCVAFLVCVDVANSEQKRLVQHSRTFETYYDEGTSVFCATRLKAVSCVYVPRDTVR